jgi:hypothetical protein
MTFVNTNNIYNHTGQWYTLSVSVFRILRPLRAGIVLHVPGDQTPERSSILDNRTFEAPRPSNPAIPAVSSVPTEMFFASRTTDPICQHVGTSVPVRQSAGPTTCHS